MIVLFWALWILLSGQLTWGTALTGAAVAAVLELFCRKCLGYNDRLNRRALRNTWAMARYLGYLVAEMMRAGFIVMKLIYTRGREMKPVLVWFDCPLPSDTARSTLANSITLTAGTITVSAEDGRFCVHALDRSLAEGIENSPFSQRLEKLEENR